VWKIIYEVFLFLLSCVVTGMYDPNFDAIFEWWTHRLGYYIVEREQRRNEYVNGVDTVGGCDVLNLV
jgi:hypothetical protein